MTQDLLHLLACFQRFNDQRFDQHCERGVSDNTGNGFNQRIAHQNEGEGVTLTQTSEATLS